MWITLRGSEAVQLHAATPEVGQQDTPLWRQLLLGRSQTPLGGYQRSPIEYAVVVLDPVEEAVEGVDVALDLVAHQLVVDGDDVDAGAAHIHLGDHPRPGITQQQFSPTADGARLLVLAR
jgi:hypothetical protein